MRPDNLHEGVHASKVQAEMAIVPKSIKAQGGTVSRIAYALLQAADYDEDTVMEYTPPEETNRRQRQREIEAEREREQKVPQLTQYLLLDNNAPTFISLSRHNCHVCCPNRTVPTVQHCTWHRALRQPLSGSFQIVCIVAMC